VNADFPGRATVAGAAIAAVAAFLRVAVGILVAGKGAGGEDDGGERFGVLGTDADGVSGIAWTA
jgi:hypothetical protein